MSSTLRRPVHVLLVLVLAAVPVVPEYLLAQDHVVSTQDLRKDLVTVAQARQDHLAKVEKFFSSDQAKKALNTAGIRYEKVQNAVRVLSDDELARLAAQADKVQKDFAAGTLTNQEITYIIIALATAVVILIIVAAR